jgi:hypothetical protein
MRTIFRTIFAAMLALAGVPAAHAGLFTNNYGAVIANVSDCDDCASTAISFGGGQSIKFFGTTYTSLYVGSNGYLTFDAPHDTFATQPIDTQTVGPMIAGLFTDLDTSGDATSNVYVNTSTAGEIIVTYEMVVHGLGGDMRSTFQLLVRADQKSLPAGQGQLGFFYGDINDTNIVSAGFGDGLASVDPREVSFASDVPGITLSNSDPRYYTLEGWTGIAPPDSNVPEPASLMLTGAAIAVLAARRRRQRP